jgi:hypothetical protein
MDKSTTIRTTQATVEALRLATSELAVATRRPLTSDDERIRALIDHWERTKGEHYAVRTPIITVN